MKGGLQGGSDSKWKRPSTYIICFDCFVHTEMPPDQIKKKYLKKHVKPMLDNATAVFCIQNMGTNHSVSCNEVTFAIWSWCIENNIWISVAHIPDKEMSRDASLWMLSGS